MTVGNPENFRVKLISSGREDVDRRVPCDLSNLTLDKLFKWIDSHQVRAVVKEELKKSASRFPHQTLNVWKNDYLKHLSKAQAKSRNKRKKEVKEIEDSDSMRAPEDTFDSEFDGENL